MALAELKTRMTEALRELDSLAAMTDRDAEQEAKVDALLAEVNDLGPKIDRETQLQAAQIRQRDYTEPEGRKGGAVPSPEAEAAAAAPQFDRRSPGRKFVESVEFRSYVKGGGRGTSEMVKYNGLVGPNIVSQARAGNRPFAFDGDGMGPEELRAVVHSGTLPASMVLPQVLPTIYRGLEAPLVMRDVLINARTTSDSVTYMSESSFTNNAAEVAEATNASTGAKPESALAFTEATAPVKYIAHWIPITRQTMEDAAQMESYINERLLIGLARREDYQIINGDGTGANFTGLLNTSGIQNLDGAYFGANPVKNAGTDNENVNRIRRAQRVIRVTGDAAATFIVAHPANVEEWDTYTDANRQYLFGGPSAAPVRTLWGLPVVESEHVPEGTALMGDGTMAAVFDRLDASIYTTDSHSDFFVRNLMVILAEERIALAVFRPAAFAKIALA